MCLAFFSLLFVALIMPSQGLPAARDIAMLDKAPSICGGTYSCSAMIQVVNYLKQVGKKKTLAILRNYLHTKGAEDAKVLVICRLLFVNPKGWDLPRLGAPVPAIRGNSASPFPLFPIAVVDHTPFLLVLGYHLEGVWESGDECLKLCEGLPLITESYPLPNYEKAALALTRMESFRELYEEKHLSEMSKMILKQAKAK